MPRGGNISWQTGSRATIGVAQGSEKKETEAEEIGNLDHINMTWSQEAWERMEKAALTGRMELNLESGGVKEKKQREKKKKNKESILISTPSG